MLAASLTEGVGSPGVPAAHERTTRPQEVHEAHPRQGLLRHGPVAARGVRQGRRALQGEGRHAGPVGRDAAEVLTSSRRRASSRRWRTAWRSTAPAARVAVIPKGPYVLPYVADQPWTTRISLSVRGYFCRSRCRSPVPTMKYTVLWVPPCRKNSCNRLDGRSNRTEASRAAATIDADLGTTRPIAANRAPRAGESFWSLPWVSFFTLSPTTALPAS